MEETLNRPFLSSVYKFKDFVNALKSLQGKEHQLWLGEGCGARAKKQALVNIASFLGQAIRETIMYDACEYIVIFALTCLFSQVMLNHCNIYHFLTKVMKITGTFGMLMFTKNQQALLKRHQRFTQCHPVVGNLVKAMKTVSLICY